MKATYSGTCVECWLPIRAGDDIRPDDLEPGEGRWMHASCKNQADLLRAIDSRAKRRPRCVLCADLLVEGRCPNCQPT